MADLLCLVHISSQGINKGMPLKCSYSYIQKKCRCENCKLNKKRSALNNYIKNKEKIKLAKKEYYQKNKDVLSKKMKKYYSENKEYIKKKSSLYSKNNTERLRVVKREYARKHPELDRNKNRRKRALKRNNGFERYTEGQVLELYGTDCYLCNTPIDMSASRRCGSPGWEKGLHIEHVIDIALGGPDTLSNVRPSHAKCNLNKKPRQMV
jgi:5-methylcytosine-specific restriction endonuclease McrA